MVVLVACIVGLLLGSFLSVLVARWPQWRGVATGRSHCPNCMHSLAWYDLIPLLSWMYMRGSCRYCRAPISAWYPVLEVSMAAVLGVYAFYYGIPTGWFAFDYLILFAMVSLFFFDVRHHMLPDAFVVPLGVFVLVRMFTMRPDLLVNAVAMGAFLSAVFGLLYAVSRGRWLGFGDVKLAGVIGLLFGYPGAIGVTMIAIWSGALFGVVMIGLKKMSMQTAIPFGSFWTAAAIMTMIWPGPVFFLSGLIIPAL